MTLSCLHMLVYQLLNLFAAKKNVNNLLIVFLVINSIALYSVVLKSYQLAD